MALNPEQEAYNFLESAGLQSLSHYGVSSFDTLPSAEQDRLLKLQDQTFKRLGLTADSFISSTSFIGVD